MYIRNVMVYSAKSTTGREHSLDYEYYNISAFAGGEGPMISRRRDL